MDTKPEGSVLNWIKRPDSWLSVSAAGISLITFYLVYLSGGRVQIETAEVGLRVSPNVSLLMPVVFYQTGPPQKQSVVKTVTARLLHAGPGPKSEGIDLEWDHSNQFISKEDYEIRYPKAEKEQAKDYVVYEARAYPFILFGRNSATKILALEPPAPAQYEMFGVPPMIDVSVVVETTAGNIVATSKYRLKVPSAADRRTYNWYTHVSERGVLQRLMDRLRGMVAVHVKRQIAILSTSSSVMSSLVRS